MPDPDLEIRGVGRGGGGAGAVSKEFFRPFGPQFSLIIRGGPGLPGPSPGSATETFVHRDITIGIVEKAPTFNTWGVGGGVGI